mmetsp:Transcript_16035/g.22840  ORF Transcript_16035/g.22840 Transcript_16035/m.22840 type:complete len:424 (-) Transcript_16035:568-1839(-)
MMISGEDYPYGFPFYTPPGGDYNKTLNIVSFFLSAFMGLLSILGSSCIIYVLLNKEHKLSSTKNRFIFAISVVDIIYTLGMGLGPLPSPQGTPGLWGAKGNTTTCTIQGFLVHIGYIIPNYTACLMLSFLLSIRYGVSEKTLTKKIEPFMHAFSILYPLVPAIVLASTGAFNSQGMTCWINYYPNRCHLISSLKCTRGKHSKNYQLFFSILPLHITIIVDFVCLGLLVCSAYKNQKMANQRTRTYLRQTIIQAVFYVVSIVVTYSGLIFWCWCYLVGLTYPPTGILVLIVITIPSIGVWHFIFLFLIPRYLELSYLFPLKSFKWKLFKATCEPNFKIIYDQQKASSELHHIANRDGDDLHNIIIQIKVPTAQSGKSGGQIYDDGEIESLSNDSDFDGIYNEKDNHQMLDRSIEFTSTKIEINS